MTTEVTIDEDTVIERNPSMLTSQIDGEVVMMDIESGQYLGLDKVASRIWELLVKPQRFDELCQMLLDEFDVDAETCAHDLRHFFVASVKNNLIHIQHAPT